MPVKIAFVGGGNMARSLIGGMVRNHSGSEDQTTQPVKQGAEKGKTTIVVSDPVTEVTQRLTQDFGVLAATSNKEAVELSDVVVLAVKPQQMHTVVSSLEGCFDGKLLISIAAGVRCTDITKWSGSNDTAVVRCMPNTPALLQCGATGLFANDNVSETQRRQTENILSAAGSIAWVSDESQLDAITALSGSGPAYFFLLLEAMTESAVELGLSKELATQFAIQTAVGASRMASEGDIEPARLRKNVTSPAGTTEAALNSFYNDGLIDTVKRAMQAANDRAVELGNELSNELGENK